MIRCGASTLCVCLCVYMYVEYVCGCEISGHALANGI